MQVSPLISDLTEPSWLKTLNLLLGENLAVANEFGKKTPDEIENILASSPQNPLDNKSYDACVDLFCLFLFEIEKEKGSVPQERLSELLGTEKSPRLGALAREFWFLSESFSQFNIPHRQAARLKAQSLCMATEAECADKLMTRLESFWPNRAIAMVDLFVTTGRRYEFHPAILECLKLLPPKYGEEKLATTTLLTSLRYILGTDKWQSLKLTVIEVANLFLFFGTDTSLDSVGLKNWMSPHQLTDSQREKMVFCCCRLHHFKTLLITPQFEIPEADQLQIEKDCRYILSVLEGIEGG